MMPSTKTKKSEPRPETPECFIFEIGAWEPGYIFSVDSGKHRSAPYSEHVLLEIDATCVFPEKLAGREIRVSISGQRDCLNPFAYRQDKDWVPRCIGLLELPPAGGRFYTSVPHDSIAALTVSLAHRMYRYILLYGPPLGRSKSLCSSMQFERTVDFENY
jgi:hypothetical protein